MAKKVKAKKNAVNVVNEAKIGQIKQDEVNSIFSCFFYANAKKDELDHAKVNISGKNVNKAANIKSDLDIMTLDLPDITKQALIKLMSLGSSKVMLGYRNVYGFAVGLVPSTAKSYKCVCSCHTNDSKLELILNQCSLFSIAEIKETLAKFKVAYKSERNFTRIGLSKEKLPKLIAAMSTLLK